MSTAEASQSRLDQVGLKLREEHPEAEYYGGPHRQREDDGEYKPRADGSGRALEMAFVFSVVGVQVSWLAFLIYLGHRLLA